MKCAIYARVSTDEQGTSIINQQEYFRDYIERNKYEIYDTYSDEAFSGTEMTKRLSFQRLIEDGKNRKYDVLLAKSYSRFGRNQRETLTALAELFECGIRIIFVEDGLDSLRDKGQFGLFAWLAEQEARKVSERIKLTWQLYNKEGRIHATNAPLGYDYSKEIKNFVINETEAELVRLIFAMYLKGDGIRKIGIYLNENGITTKHGRKWSHPIVSQTLTNEFYIGTLTQGKRRTIDVTIKKMEFIDKKDWHVHKNNHEAIISVEDFYAVQEQYNKRSVLVHETRRSRHSNRHLYSNVLKCKLCGASFTYLSKKVEDRISRYSCIAYEQQGLKICGHRRNSITEQAITSMIKSELETLSENNFKALKDYYKLKKSGGAKKDSRLDLKKIEKQIEKKTAMSLKLLDAYTKGIVGDNQFKLQNDAIEKDLQGLMTKREIALEQASRLAIDIDEEKETTTAIQTLLSMSEGQWTNEMVKRVVDRVEVSMREKQADIFFIFQIPS